MLRDLPLIAVALLPAVVLCVYVYKKDRVEKEPAGLLARLALAGVVCVIPAGLLETFFIRAQDGLFAGVTVYENGQAYMPDGAFYLYNVIQNFLIVAVVEEGLKWIAVRALTARNKSFNSLFDGIVYCVFCSLGFAAAENVSYTFQYGFSTALVRAFTAVPGHMFFAVIMGYYYSLWHVQMQSKKIENELVLRGYLPAGAPSAFNTRGPLVKSLLLPVFVHGFYDYCCSLNSVFSDVLFYAFLIGLYALCFTRVKKLSAIDTYSGKLAMGMVFRRYPDVAASFGITETPVYEAETVTER